MMITQLTNCRSLKFFRLQFTTLRSPWTGFSLLEDFLGPTFVPCVQHQISAWWGGTWNPNISQCSMQALGHMVSPGSALLWSMPDWAYAGIIQNPWGRSKMSWSQYEVSFHCSCLWHEWKWNWMREWWGLARRYHYWVKCVMTGN